MKFSDNDLQVLTNFSEINDNIKFRKGKIILTRDPHKSILAQYQLNTTITEDFCLYSLSEFLNFYDLYENPTISIKQEILNQYTKENYKKIIIKDKRFTTEYCCCDEKLLDTPTKERIPIFNKILDYQLNFHLSKNDIKDINRIKSKISLDKLNGIIFENQNGNINIKLEHFSQRWTSRTNNNQISFFLSNDSFLKNKTNHKFKFLLSSENFKKILIGDYNVEYLTSPTNKKDSLLKLTSMSLPLTYWIAIEKGCDLDTVEEVITNA